MSQHQQMSPQMLAELAQGPPYIPPTAVVGGVPSIAVDVPITSVFLCLYIVSAAVNMFFFQRNRIRGVLFIPTVLLFGFSMARILTCILRIVWATRQHDASTALAAQIFNNAGILIIYIINLLFSMRILRALQPQIGWHRIARIIPRIAYALIACCLILIIVLIVYGSYTLSESFHNAQKWVLRGVSLYLLIFAAAPLIIVPMAFVLPRSEAATSFGEGSMMSKAAIVTITTVLCTLISGFRAGTSWSAARPITDPAWYDSRASFYCFGFTLEILTLIVYTSSMMHKRFAVPDDSSKRGTYVVEALQRSASEAGTGMTEDVLEEQKSEPSSPTV